MSALVGARVVRGPSWNWGEQDGGEGHLGTITAVVVPVTDHTDGDSPLSPTAVKVTWDSGKKGNYRTGFGGEFDLRLYSSAPAGVIHRGVRCVGCDASDIAGSYWICTMCPRCKLCTDCYMQDTHAATHEFCRKDEPYDTGVLVGPREDARTVKARGLLPGAKVKRGPDWNYEDEDGGKKQWGNVKDVCDWSDSSRASGVLVQWSNGLTKKYRAGHDGKVDVKATEGADGECFYIHHLASVGERQSPMKGDKLMIVMDTECLNLYQKCLGQNCPDGLSEKLGVAGFMENWNDRGWIGVRYDDGVRLEVPSFLLKKCVEFHTGVRVRISSNIDLIQRLQPGHGGWTDTTKLTVGQYGRVVKVCDDGDVMVEVKGDELIYHPALITIMEDGEVEDAGDEDDDDIGVTAAAIDKSIINKGETKDTDEDEQMLRNILVERLTDKIKQVGLKDGSKAEDKAFVRSAAEGKVDKVRELLRQRPELVKAKHSSRTALHVASHEGYLPVVQLLVEANAPLEEKDDDGDTALAYAVIGNNPSIVEYLIKRGAYANATNKRRLTPLHLSAAKGHQACAMKLLRRGGSVNVQDNVGNLPVHLAIKRNSDSLLEPLINNPQADLRLRNAKGFTPLHYAVRNKLPEAVKLILARDPKLCEIQKDDGYTPLHLAVVNNHIDIARQLLEHASGSVNVAENGGKATPLHFATHLGYSEIIEMLVDHGADVNAKDKDADTALHVAVKRRRSSRREAVRSTSTFDKLREELRDTTLKTSGDTLLAYLIRHGSDVTIKNKHGLRPLDLLRDQDLRKFLMTLSGVAIEEDAQLDKPDKRTKAEEQRQKPAVKRAATPQRAAAPTKRPAQGAFGGIHYIERSELHLGDTVGRGGFGEVKKAVWRGTTVAVKILPTAGSQDSEVKKEISIHKQVRHPNIVPLMAVAHEVGQALVVMEFINGHDLYHVLFEKKCRERIPLTWELKMAISLDLLTALTYLHASKILHLDIKPSNVMVAYGSSRAYLCDLGLAHIKTRSAMSLSTSVRGPRGTMLYMAPEIAEHHGAGWACAANDIWSIACTFLELFVEKRLWDGMDLLAVMQKMLKPAAKPPILPKASPQIRKLLEPCFERDPQTRPSAETLLEQFRLLQQNPAEHGSRFVCHPHL
ncbi:E3 ubiquitin-protein ligase mind-bomb-like [Diadema antillarum]|uniref:E3 ubiquitin-protein ligase mind-bomb-like n=1 Tax=Diadema antillarum TaxID=105358 RepID=UPI003A8B7D13